MVQEWFWASRFSGGERLPAERDLALSLGLSRPALRNGLAALEAEGHLRREVGRGTFVKGASAVPSPGGEVRDGTDNDASPRQLLVARLSVEPRLAALAAREASTSALDRLREAERAVADARTWVAFEAADDAFHRAVVAAAGNHLLLRVFDTLIQTRRAIDWGRLVTRSGEGPPVAHAAIGEHATIRRAIVTRDAHAAEAALAHHLLVEASTILGGLV